MALTKNQLEKLNGVVSKTSQILSKLFKVAEDMDEKREYLEGLIIQANKMNCLASNMRNGVVPYDSKEIKIENIKLPHWIMLKYDCAVCSNCGHDHYTGFYTTKEATERWHELYKYCPMCGTRMWSSFEKEEQQ